MHLSSLTLRGFKSFADKTTLALEPGVTVIVGPNGSGKSNVVDALTWVLGTQSPRLLRGGAMSDVIFAGAAERPALGRAAVEITIDNSDGTLPLDFSEVTIGRAMFASGETEYTINGASCRQLDIAELLSDTGLGRESHTIVSQGQLDAVLSARPEERRAFIDEAAGISKHRKRKDRAVRKLEQMQQHATRLHDVTRELARSLRPLERQAEAAARHAELTAQLRAVRIERSTDELRRSMRRHQQLHDHHRDQAAVARQLQDQAQRLRADEARAEHELTELRPAVDQAAATHFRLAATVERLRAVQTQIAERRRGLQAALDEPVMLRDPADVRKAAAAERERLDDAEREVSARQKRLAECAAQRDEAERARRAHSQAAAVESRRRAAARERRLRWEGKIAALRSALAQAASEQGRLDGRLVTLREQQQRCAADVAAAERACARLTRQREEHAQQAARCDAAVDACRAEHDAAVLADRACERRRAALTARAETLQATVAEVPDGTRSILEAELDGIVGRLADHVTVEPGYERAVTAVLGKITEALVASDPAAAAQAAGFARNRDDGRVRLLASPDRTGPARRNDLPSGVRLLTELMTGDTAALGSVAMLLRDTVVAPDYEAACALAQRRPDLVVVTPAGELAGAAGYVVGGALPAGAVEQRAQLADTRRQLTQLLTDAERIGERITAAVRARDEAEQLRSDVVDRLKAAAAALNERTAQLRRLQAEAAACLRELQAVEQAAQQLNAEVALRSAELTALETGDEPVSDDDEESPDLEAERLEDVLRSARDAEVGARVSLSSAGSRRDEIGRRIASIEHDADELERAWAIADLRQQRRRVGIERCAQLAALAQRAVDVGGVAVEAAEMQRLTIEDRRDTGQQALGALRTQLAQVERTLSDHTRSQHADELSVATARHALENARRRCRDLGLDPDVLAADADEPLRAEEHEALGEREEDLARRVALLGLVNPLAVEEFAALQERQRFLTAQIDDLERSRRDLLEMVAAVDERIREVFAAAFSDVAVEFERLFARLFPGGEGRLVLTAPDDLLHTGVDVEARPAGKRVKRLSLLSGGERSLVALALAFAIFAARPSPFYVLDEVEAALDDINLQRVLDVMREFRSSSQLIVITHQKRTMEIADVLFGVTMRSGGVSRVLSQRLSDVA